jgi:hypothetical protein
VTGKQVRPFWTSREIAEADRIVRAGGGVPDIVAATGRSARAIGLMRHRRRRDGEDVPDFQRGPGVPFRNPWTEAELAKAGELIRNGASLDEAAAAVGKTTQTLSATRYRMRTAGESVPVGNGLQRRRTKRRSFDLLETDEL